MTCPSDVFEVRSAQLDAIEREVRVLADQLSAVTNTLAVIRLALSHLVIEGSGDEPVPPGEPGYRHIPGRYWGDDAA